MALIWGVAVGIYLPVAALWGNALDRPETSRIETTTVCPFFVLAPLLGLVAGVFSGRLVNGGRSANMQPVRIGCLPSIVIFAVFFGFFMYLLHPPGPILMLAAIFPTANIIAGIVGGAVGGTFMAVWSFASSEYF
jgi:hypothetical protein